LRESDERSGSTAITAKRCGSERRKRPRYISASRAAIEQILAANPKQVAQYRGGDAKVLGWFVGQVMRATRGQADPATLDRLLRERLER